MRHKVEEKIKSLEQFLDHYKKRSQSYNGFNNKTRDANKIWNAALFFTNILLTSDYSGCEITENEFQVFTQEYEDKNEVKIDTENLFLNFWLRQIFGKIYVPNIIIRVANDFKKNKTKRNELLFIKNLKNTLKINSITSADLNKQIKNFEINKKVSLDRIWLDSSHYFKKSDKDDILEVGSVDHYNKLLENWNEFEYLNSFIDYKETKYSRSALIDKKAFDNIYNSHKKLFPKIPDYHFFISNNTISSIDVSFKIHFHTNGGLNFIRELAEYIIANIWQRLLDDISFINDKERLRSLLSYSRIDGLRSNFVLHLSNEAKQRFKTVALDTIMNETDLNNIEYEFDKAILEDNIHSLSNWSSNVKFDSDSLKPTEDSYKLYDQMLKVSDNYNGNLFYIQSSRSEVSYLIDQLLLLDVKTPQVSSLKSFTYSHYPITKQLLNAGLSKPYLLWTTAFFLKRNGAIRLPFLLLEESLTSLIFRLLDNVEVEALLYDTLSQIRTKTLKIAIELIFDEFSTRKSLSKDKFATIIFQIIREINRDKFQIERNSRSIELYEQNIIDKKNRENQLLNIIENYTVEINQFPRRASVSFLSGYIKPLLQCTELHTPFKELSNGYWQLPLYKLDYLSWLSKIIIDCELKKKKIDTNIGKEVSDNFLIIYREAIEKVSIKKKNFPSLEMIDSIPNWQILNEPLDKVNWIYPLILLDRNKKTSNFFKPSIKFNPSQDSYDDLNQYSAKRLRSHLFILLSTLNTINYNPKNFIKLRKEVKGIKKKIESRIIKILQENAIQNKIDILDAQFERSIYKSNKEELIPELAKSINWFSDKAKMLNVLIKTSDLLRILLIIEWITAEGLKKELLKRIKKSKIKKFLKSKNWIPELELTITKLTSHPKLVKQTKSALNYWKKNVSTNGKKNLEEVRYLVELMIAYNETDEQSLDKIESPKQVFYKIQKRFSFNDYKQFFRGLIRFEINPESACQIFNDLYYKFPNHSSIALNRFAAKINFASKNEDEDLFEDALSEWEQMEENLSDTNLQTIKDSIWINKLTAYYHLNDKNKFDQLYLSIPYPYQMKEDMIELKIGILLKNQLKEEAKKVLYYATEYHKDSSGRQPKFITNLKTKLDYRIDIKLLQNNYNEIFSKQPETLIKILPERLNAENKIARFITREIALASSKMLDQINSIRDIHKEDKYNDIIQLLLEARMSQWGWQVKDQPRGGFSGSKASINPGERDLMICDSNGDTLIICEAFIWSSLSIVESHINKNFNYTHKRKDFIILIYDKRSNKNFVKNWNNYKENVLPKISYTSGFELKKSKWKELTKVFGYKASGIKSGISYHGNKTKVYHIMVNLNYKSV